MSNVMDSQIIVGNPGSNPTEKPKKEKVYHFLVAGAATVVVLAGIKAASAIIGPMMLALFLTIILLVPLRWLRKKGCPNSLSLIIVLGGTVLVFSAVGYFVGKSLNDFVKSIPTYRARIIRKVDELDKKYDQFLTNIGLNKESQDFLKQQPNVNAEKQDDGKKNADNRDEAVKAVGTENAFPVPSSMERETPSTHPEGVEGVDINGKKDDIEDDELSELDDSDGFKEMFEATSAEKPPLITLDAKSVMYWVTWGLAELRHLLEGGFLVLIFTVFMIFEAARFHEKVDCAFGKEGPINNEHFHRIADDIRRYLFLKAISSLMSALAATFVYWIFGVPATLFWGVIAFFLYFIPNIGGTLAAIIPGLLIFMTYDLEGVLLYAVCLVAIECSIAYGIEPKMLGHGLGISTVVIILSLFSWGWLLGPIGLFLAAPLTIMVKIILQAFKETEWIAILLGDKVRN